MTSSSWYRGTQQINCISAMIHAFTGVATLRNRANAIAGTLKEGLKEQAQQKCTILFRCIK
jgi:hypothetical protein